MTPLTLTHGLTIVVSEHLTPRRRTSRSPMRRTQVIARGKPGEATVTQASSLHRKIVDWWEGDHDFVRTK